MNPLQRALVEKAGHDYGFENVLITDGEAVHMGSARHSVQVAISEEGETYRVEFASTPRSALTNELRRSFPGIAEFPGAFAAESAEALAAFLSRASELARSLPNQAASDFEFRLKQELDKLPASLKGTEVERVVKQRVGQDAYRRAMIEYWGGACAVTGLELPTLLRASHAKPWADCESDAERLDVYNGFLLTANLDALFDRFLISFNDDGCLLSSATLTYAHRQALGLDQVLGLRWLAQEHLPYLHLHRARFESGPAE